MFKMGLSLEIYSYCTQNSPDNYIHVTWYCRHIQHFWKEITNTLSLFLGCHMPLSHSLFIINQPEPNKQQITSHSPNYRQENHLHELEIRKYYSHCSLEKLTHGSHPNRNCIHLLPKYKHRPRTHLAIPHRFLTNVITWSFLFFLPNSFIYLWINLFMYLFMFLLHYSYYFRNCYSITTIVIFFTVITFTIITIAIIAVIFTVIIIFLFYFNYLFFCLSTNYIRF